MSSFALAEIEMGTIGQLRSVTVRIALPQCGRCQFAPVQRAWLPLASLAARVPARAQLPFLGFLPRAQPSPLARYCTVTVLYFLTSFWKRGSARSAV